MPSPDSLRPIYRFGDFEFEPRTAELRRHCRALPRT